MKLNQIAYVWCRKKFLKKIIRTAETLLKNNDVNKEKYSPTKYVVLHFHVKAIKLVRGLLVLCKAGLMSNAKILLRSLFEVAYYCEYILLDPKDIKAAENIMALSAFEDKNTKETLIRYGIITTLDVKSLGNIGFLLIGYESALKDFLKVILQREDSLIQLDLALCLLMRRKKFW